MPEQRVAGEGISVSIAERDRRALPTPVPPRRLLPAVVGLTALAVGQPLLDLLARQPQFLVAHGLSSVGMVVAVALIVVVPAGAATLLAVAAARWRWAVAGAVGVPLLLIVLHVGRRLGVGGLPVLILGIAVAATGGYLYVRSRFLQDAAWYLVFVPLAVLAYFFLVLPPGVLAAERDEQGASLGRVGDPVPVVIVVLDELPLASLIDASGALLEEHFPSFARLAADGVWYRNALTVETSTAESIPAILSGRRVPDGSVPTASQHPATLFTLLSSSHQVSGVETVTQLCPSAMCRDGDEAGRGSWAALASDLAVVYAHVLVPDAWAEHLPAIDQNWTGFLGVRPDEPWDLVEAVGEAVQEDRRRHVSNFLALLESPASKPLLAVAHFALPHRPWEFLPDGTPHGQDGVEGYGPRQWGEDEYFVAEGWRRHLLQVGYSDTVVGAVIDRLERAGLYESSLVAVVADHGVHFRAGIDDMRVTNRDSYGSILPVPLLVKYPRGLPGAPPAGTIDDRRVETVDIVPTILDVIDADVAGLELDGVSMLSGLTRDGSELDLRGEPFVVGIEGDEKLAVARQKEEWFPGSDPWSLVPHPSLRELIGRSLATEDAEGTEVTIAEEHRRPPLVEGEVTSTDGLTGEELVVLTADGVVVSITKVFEVDERGGSFSFLLDPGRTHRPPLEAWVLAGQRLLR